MRILRAAGRMAAPWKNGGGTTAEIAAHPPGAGLDDFDWRVSVADVRSGGPFSRFAGIDRKLALLEGALTLAIEGRETVSLTPASLPVEFPGDVKTQAILTGGDAKDLNVMTRRGVARSTMTRYKAGGRIACDPGASVGILYFLSAAVFSAGTKDFMLHPGDAVSLSPNRALTLRAVADFYRIDIFANG